VARPDGDSGRYRIFRLHDGWEVLVGRTDRDNDWLSIRHASPCDFWFHVAGMPGSHVIARHPTHPERIDREVKRTAAALAVYYSKARNAGRTMVHWTTCRNVSKPRGAPPGQVRLKRFNSIHSRPMHPAQIGEDDS